MISSTADFASHVADHCGLPADQADHAARAVLAGIGPYLGPAHRQLVAEELPRELAAALLAIDDRAAPLETRVLELGFPITRAREVIASVGHVLAEELSSDALRVLRDDVPAMQPFLDEPAPALDRAAARAQTLATARPGSRHPISETPPPPAQTGSVADPNPHDATKLSSTSGTTQERRHESLADADPFRRGISRSRS
ncbi:MAG TPA: hypothetical protein VFQ53_13885 [Kofleriaceae bacterium]|nr:hypothetical protein [Kofleriaceae bacterium]